MKSRWGTTEERFLKRVDRRGPDECWPWIGPVSGPGYGRLEINGKPSQAHRYAYERVHGPIPVLETAHGWCVCHRCDNRRCCNPAHLFLATQGDNLRDMWAKKRGNAVAAFRVGEKHPLASVTNAQAVEIFLAEPDQPTGCIERLAAQYSVHKCAIYAIRNRKTYREATKDIPMLPRERWRAGEPLHGYYLTYMRHRCRCEECRRVWNAREKLRRNGVTPLPRFVSELESH